MKRLSLLCLVALAGACGSNAGTPDAGSACASNDDCDPGTVCDLGSGVCIPEDSPCQNNSDCGQGQLCGANGECEQNVPGGPCDTTENCVLGETCTGDVCGCGGSLYSADNVPPNVLIVLDRSGSMNQDISGGTKWQVAQQAISDLLMAYGDQILFGLMLYPGLDQACDTGMDCGPGNVFIDVGPDTAADIDMFLGNASTCRFGTPTAENLDTLPSYPGLEDTERANYVLLVTDGQSTCNDPIPSVTALRNETPEIKTFVVGFGSGVDPTELSAMATAGGTARATDPVYYQADSAADLQAAFTAIAGNVLSCSYTLSDVPPDPDLLFIYFDGTAISRDPTHADGWDYDPATNQITFYGAACDSLRSGAVTDLVISYGCPVNPIP